MSVQPLTTYFQCRTFNHVYHFKLTGDQSLPKSLTLKVYNHAQERLHKVAAPQNQLIQWSSAENGTQLLNLFRQSGLLPPEFLSRSLEVDHIQDLQKLIAQAKSKVSVENENTQHFTCPLTLGVFEDPVIDEHGHTFEKTAIEEHLKRNPTCPLNREPISSLTPNRQIKDAIDAWKKKDPIPTFNQYKQNNPILFGKHLETAQSCVEQGEYEEALQAYAKAFQYTNDWKNYSEVPKLFERRGRKEEAMLAYLYLILYQLQDGKRQEAIQTLKHVIDITPFHHPLDQFLIQLYQANGQKLEATEHALKVAQALTSIDPLIAIRFYEQALANDPTRWNIYPVLAELHQDSPTKTHILLKGVIHALEHQEHQTAQHLAQSLPPTREETNIKAYPSLQILKRENPIRYREKLQELADLAKTMRQPSLMIKYLKMLTQINYNPDYYKDIIAHTKKKELWTQIALAAAIENKDWENAQEIAQIALAQTKQPIPILNQLEVVYTNWDDHELSNLWSQLGQEHEQNNQLDQAERTYRKAYEKFQTLEHGLSLANTLQKQRKHPESLQVYYEATTLALLNDKLETLDTILARMHEMDPSFSSFTTAQKVQIATYKHLTRLSLELKSIKQTETVKKELALSSAPLGKAAAKPVEPSSETPPRVATSLTLPLTPFGKAAWAQYFGDIGLEPALPPNIQEILQAPCPIWPGKKVYETHLLTLIPAAINGAPLTLQLLGQLVEKPLQGGNRTKYSHFYLGETPDTAFSQNYWVLMTKDVIPNSRSKSYSAQCQLLQSYPGYEVPKRLEVAASLFMEHAKTGTRLYSDSPWTYTRCQEKYDKTWQTCVGGFAPGGLGVGFNFVDYEHVGVGGLRKF